MVWAYAYTLHERTHSGGTMYRPPMRQHAHRHAVLHDRGGEPKLLRVLVGNWLQAVGAQYMGCQRFDFDVSKVNPNAQAWATSKRDQPIGCPPVLLAWRREAVGVKHLRVGKDSGQPVTCGQG